MFSVPTFTGPVEFTPSFSPRPQISHVVFDFDGTLSWLRHGWPELMYQLFRPLYPTIPGETEATIHNFLLGEILSLNGKPTIFQTNRFAELVHARGAQSPSPEALLHDYQSRLDQIIAERTNLILTGRASKDDFVVFGARKFLDQLHAQGIKLIILSGTIEHRVKEEAALLNLAHYFGQHIYGSRPDSNELSKRIVLDRLLRDEKIEGHHLLSFGDGPVEIFHTRELGGLAVAVASDEDDNGSGKMDPHKRQQLLKAGADVVIPDYRDAATLLKMILQR
ncbi:HAD family hydrolase [Pedosphaera parvula]|uniref:phosphoglycolate phosphatase n=1 Tax=Pedosphaera parvula (strain Ellin514) TaxID=320771 RepID=B9XFS7_PEDPL|nr:HAD family hydrolase [Pedosphaera parvula]EEF61441.1 Haloacid dehalogenase domain protein hydrolase [Pedosphaera parvula Ellin514]